MIHFDERRSFHSTRRPAEEEPMWRSGWGGGSGKPKKANRKKETGTPSVKTSTVAVPKTHRIDVVPEYKSGLYRNIYWMHPNLAITRESRGQEEFVGEYIYYQAVNANVIVNFFPALEYCDPTKLRFAHTAHTPPACRAPAKSSEEYLRKNMETLIKKIDILAFQQQILESRPTDN
ncbi:unnamed protein product [Caenorhabditis sp. 36 PRJEB53466]|nr:unnamed protein product [Caenorhabditis sp. 36 PRJEB53466]